MAAMAGAVVFAYHNVGYRCLSVLLAGGGCTTAGRIRGYPNETIWFDSVASGEAGMAFR